MTSWPTS